MRYRGIVLVQVSVYPHIPDTTEILLRSSECQRRHDVEHQSRLPVALLGTACYRFQYSFAVRVTADILGLLTSTLGTAIVDSIASILGQATELFSCFEFDVYYPL